jgi:hypothetical protein
VCGLGYVLVAGWALLVVVECRPSFDGTFPNGLAAEIAVINSDRGTIYREQSAAPE